MAVINRELVEEAKELVESCVNIMNGSLDNPEWFIDFSGQLKWVVDMLYYHADRLEQLKGKENQNACILL